jgi:triacylglycerol esterase/lipase EstA (alpha/beta hydrolase family)
MSSIKRIMGVYSSPTSELDVVFVHGLDGDPVKTWSSGSEESFWPRWLADDNPAAAVWCVGFEASASRWRGSPMGVLDRATNLLALLQTNGIGKRPLCLIGHSLGGLMAKEILFQAAAIAPDYQELAAQARGVVFLGTPHDGASIARIAKHFGILRPDRTTR